MSGPRLGSASILLARSGMLPDRIAATHGAMICSAARARVGVRGSMPRTAGNMPALPTAKLAVLLSRFGNRPSLSTLSVLRTYDSEIETEDRLARHADPLPPGQIGKLTKIYRDLLEAIGEDSNRQGL